MYNIEITYQDEPVNETMAFIESRRNWDVANQRYRDPSDTKYMNLAECKIYWRGERLILEHKDIIHYWDFFPYCFLKQAVEYMELDKPAKWKTLDKLIAFRMAIRQTEVNGCGYVEDILEGKKMSESLYNTFMRLARAQDFVHHGSNTF